MTRQPTIPSLDPAVLQSLDEKFAEVVRQRDELLAACKAARRAIDGITSGHECAVCCAGYWEPHKDYCCAATVVPGIDVAIANAERSR